MLPRLATLVRALASCLPLAILPACPTPPHHCDDSHVDSECPAPPLPSSLFVAMEGSLGSFDIASGEERPGSVQEVAGAVNMQVLEDGTALVNLSTRNQVLAIDGRTMLEKARLPSSSRGAVRPVHSYISPTHGGARYWFSLNDGATGQPSTNSALMVDLTPGSTTYLAAVGEFPLGVGHHKAAFSATQARVAISNLGDCENVISVYDYSNPGDVKTVKTFSAAELGWDGTARKCDPTNRNGSPPAPHGCATSKLSNKAYCNLTSTGDIVAIDIDAPVPTAKVLATAGSGGGYTKAHPGGRFIYSVQSTPREGDTRRPGAVCQIGQLVVVDAQTDTVARQVPLLYKGPGCADSILAGDEKSAGPGHLLITLDGKTLFIGTAGGFGAASDRVRQELVMDLTDPAVPSPKAAIAVGASSGHHDDVLSGDGKYLFVANNEELSLTQVDVATLTVVRTLSVKGKPQALATFGQPEGPSEQVGPIH